MFYESRLKDGQGMAKLRFRPWHHSALLAPYRFFDVEGMHQSAPKGHSLVNIAELKVAMQLYDRLSTDCKNYDFRGKVGIITPYKGQLKELKARFSQRYGQRVFSEVEFNTTDAFQGRESEVIIFSCVRASTKGIGFLNDVRRMNVGLTRAKCSLWVLGSSKSLIQGEFWRHLVEDAKARSLYTSGDISSLLQRPLLTEDMMRDDVEMGGASPTASSAASSGKLSVRASSPVKSGPRKTSMSQLSESGQEGGPKFPVSSIHTGVPDPPRPASNASSASSYTPVPKSGPDGTETLEGHPRPTEPRLNGGVNGPSGGRFGLNPHAVCNICGSDTHFSHACDNDIARTASLGHCSRCNLPGHTRNTCDAPRCLECGAVGHMRADCDAEVGIRLSLKEKEEVEKQETHFRRGKDRARERRAEDQLGEHAAKVPVVGSTLSPYGTATIEQVKRGSSGFITPAESKRKREEPAFVQAPKGHKAMRVSKGPSVLVPVPSSGGDGRPPEEAVGRVLALQGPENEPAQSETVRKGKAIVGSTARPPLGATVMKKKRPKDDDMFMKKR